MLRATNPVQKELTHIVVVHDICHALNLGLKDSIDGVPKSYMSMIKDIASTFSISPQKAAKLKLYFGHKDSTKAIKVIKWYILTRWSSLQECLDRILEVDVKKALQQYFEENGTNDQKKYFEEENIILLQLILCVLTQSKLLY